MIAQTWIHPETRLGVPCLSASGWGSLPLLPGYPEGVSHAARYLIDGEWLTTEDMAGDARNADGLSQRNLLYRCKTIERHGIVLWVAPYLKRKHPDTGTHALTWAICSARATDYQQWVVAS